MKKLLAILLVVAMLSAMAVFASAENYAVSSETLKYRAAGGTGLSVGDDGQTVSLSQPASNAHWSNAQLMVSDDIKDGFTVKVSNIVWDTDSDMAVALVYSNHPTAAYCGMTSDTASNFTLLVKKDGSLVLWGNGYNSNHTMGKWTEICITDKTLGKSVTEFTYSLVPNEAKTAFTFYVDDVAVYTYDINNAPENHAKSIFSKLDTPCNFGFMVLDGDGSFQNGWGKAPAGTLSYKIAEVNSVGTAPSVNGGEGGEGGNGGEGEGGESIDDSSNFTLAYRSGSGTGLSVGSDGKTVTLSQPANNPHWSNAQYMAGDDIKDGFTVKVTDIVWDANNNNAVAIVYSNNATSAHPSNINETASCFVLLVKRDGSIVLWGNGYNSNHHMGKWTGVCVTDKTLGKTVTEFTYKLVPNAAKTAFTFYVDDVAVYTYDINNAPTYHDKSIFNKLDTPCNFGFMVLDGEGNLNTGWNAPTGTLSYKVSNILSEGKMSGNNQGGNAGGSQGGNANTGDMSWVALAVAAVAVMGCGVVVAKKKSSER